MMLFQMSLQPVMGVFDYSSRGTFVRSETDAEREELCQSVSLIHPKGFKVRSAKQRSPLLLFTQFRQANTFLLTTDLLTRLPDKGMTYHYREHISSVKSPNRVRTFNRNRFSTAEGPDPLDKVTPPNKGLVN